MNISKNREQVILAISIGLIFVAIGYYANFEFSSISDYYQRHFKLEYSTTINDSTSEELVLIYIGSSTCSFCQSDDLPMILDKAKIILNRKADSLGYAINVIGIAVDNDVYEGIRHIQKQGEFNEILVGNNWRGIGSDRYIWNKYAGPGDTPQLIVTKRIYHESGQLSGDSNIYGIKNESVLIRKIGLYTIERWIELGMHVPDIN